MPPPFFSSTCPHPTMPSKKETRISLDELQALIALVDAHGLEELLVEAHGVRVALRTSTAVVSVPEGAKEVPVTVLAPSPAGTASTEPSVSEDEQGQYTAITSPMAGVFYRAPRPDEPPYINEGDFIEVGQTVGLIEAMKIFSPVLSDVRGRVVAIPAQNATMVHEGTVLVLVEPAESDMSEA